MEQRRKAFIRTSVCPLPLDSTDLNTNIQASNGTQTVQLLCNTITHFLHKRGVLSATERMKLEASRLSETKLEQIAKLLTSVKDTKLGDDLVSALGNDPSFAWFTLQLMTTDALAAETSSRATSWPQTQHQAAKSVEKDGHGSLHRLARTLSEIRPETGGHRGTTLDNNTEHDSDDQEQEEELRNSVVSNKSMKLKCQRFHEELIAEDLTPVIHNLFSHFVLTQSDYCRLMSIDDVRSRSEQFLSILYASRHQKAFLQLQQAMENKDGSLSRLARKLDAFILNSELYGQAN